MMDDFIIPKIELPAGVKVLMTTRIGGVSDSPYHSFNLSLRVGDDEGAVQENRIRLASQLPAPPCWLYQSHGSRVVCAEQLTQNDVEVADAVYSNQPDGVCAIQTADCLPIVLFSEAGECIAMAHAGWRGLVSGVIQTVTEKMRENTSAPLYAYIGPHIHADNYEIKEEVYKQLHISQELDSAFLANTNTESWQVNLSIIAAFHLKQCHTKLLGVSPDCTYKNPRLFYSARRESITGRQACLIYKHQ